MPHATFVLSASIQRAPSRIVNNYSRQTVLRQAALRAQRFPEMIIGHLPPQVKSASARRPGEAVSLAMRSALSHDVSRLAVCLAFLVLPFDSRFALARPPRGGFRVCPFSYFPRNSSTARRIASCVLRACASLS
jgi:hypothetical protein